VLEREYRRGGVAWSGGGQGNALHLSESQAGDRSNECGGGSHWCSVSTAIILWPELTAPCPSPAFPLSLWTLLDFHVYMACIFTSCERVYAAVHAQGWTDGSKPAHPPVTPDCSPSKSYGQINSATTDSVPLWESVTGDDDAYLDGLTLPSSKPQQPRPRTCQRRNQR
jgi:hypothetical protein